jgi:hypothetical protein
MEGTVIAPVEVQQLFSPEAPGQLFVVATVPSLGDLRDSQSVFCAPLSDSRRISARDFRFWCAETVPVQVSAFAVPRSSAQIDCTGAGAVRPPQQPTYGPETFDPAAAVATASQEASVDVIGSAGCSDGRIAFTLTLAPRPMSGDRL